MIYLYSHFLLLIKLDLNGLLFMMENTPTLLIDMRVFLLNEIIPFIDFSGIKSYKMKMQYDLWDFSISV